METLQLSAAARACNHALCEEQDAAFRKSARLDREKEACHVEEAHRTAELEKAAMERQHAADEARARISDARDCWRRECRHQLIPLEEPVNADPIRITIRLPDGQCLVRLIARTSTVPSLYCLVDAHLVPTDGTGEEIGTPATESNLRELVHSSGQPAEVWWGFSLFTAYPRKAIPWEPVLRLAEVGLKDGGQIVVEIASKEGEKIDQDEEGYDTEKSE